MTNHPVREDRFLFVSRSSPHHGVGGMEIMAWELARELVRQGASVGFLTTQIPGKSRHFQEDGVEVHALPGVRPGVYSAAWWHQSREYFRSSLGHDYSAVLSVSAGAYGLLAERSTYPEIRFFLQAHGTSWGEVVSKWRTRNLVSIAKSLKNIWWLPIDWRAYSLFDGVVSVGASVQASLATWPNAAALRKTSTGTIPNGIDQRLFSFSESARTKRRAELKLAFDDVLLISVNRLHAQKGVHEAMAAFLALAEERPTAQYVVIGDGPLAEGVLVEAEAAGASERVSFLGSLTRKEIAEWLSAADVFLFPTLHSEGLPLNCMEAAAAGLPLVVSSHLKLQLDNDNQVLRVDPHDARQVARAVEVGLQRVNPDRASHLPFGLTLERCAKEYLDLMSGHASS